MTPRADALDALRALADALLAGVKAAGTDGAPAGVLYAGVMDILRLDQFEALMSALVRAGKVRKSGHLYFTA